MQNIFPVRKTMKYITDRKTCLTIILTIAFSIGLGFYNNRTSIADSRGYAAYLGIQEFPRPVEAKDFTLKDIANKKINLKSYRGKVVMLNFWATWCGPCRMEMPSMERLHQQFKDKAFVIISVASGDSREEVSSFMKEYRLTFPALLDDDYEVSDEYKVWAVPTTYFINTKGEIIGKAQGGRDWSTRAATQYISSIF
ncbi:MAG: TlpA family protein disulfide reductase [Nitrospirae bacterium]|nr:TlpA family protein disulfide reductase [Nitrospirota bacterium]